MTPGVGSSSRWRTELTQPGLLALVPRLPVLTAGQAGVFLNTGAELVLLPVQQPQEVPADFNFGSQIRRMRHRAIRFPAQ